MCLNNDRKDKKFKSEEITKVKYTIYAAAKRKHEKIWLARIQTRTSAILVQSSKLLSW